MRNAKVAIAAPDASWSGTITKAIGTFAKRCFSVGARNTGRPSRTRAAASATVITTRSPTRSSTMRARIRPPGSSTKKPALCCLETTGARTSRRCACAGAVLSAAGSPPVRLATAISASTSVRTRGSAAITAARFACASSHCPSADALEASMVRSEPCSRTWTADETAQ